MSAVNRVDSSDRVQGIPMIDARGQYAQKGARCQQSKKTAWVARMSHPRDAVD